MKSSRIRGKRDVVNPIFLTCKPFCPNEYWKGVFDDLAYGKYPKQLYISGGYMQNANRKKVSFYYNLKNGKNPKYITEDIIEILTNHTDLISSDEIKKKKDDNEQFKKDTWNQWKDIKRKYIKDVLLMEYCLDLRKIYGWTLKKATEVFQALTLRVYGGQLTDIKMSQRRIESITGMEVQPNGEVTFDASAEFRAELVYPMEDYIYNYCKRYVNRSSKVFD
jgi:hypothetical protein